MAGADRGQLVGVTDQHQLAVGGEGAHQGCGDLDGQCRGAGASQRQRRSRGFRGRRFARTHLNISIYPHTYLHIQHGSLIHENRVHRKGMMRIVPQELREVL